MADQFQYVKLPNGEYGKFRGDATDDVIRGAISKDFPDYFRSATSPIAPPATDKLRRPPQPNMQGVDLLTGDPHQSTADQVGDMAMGMVKQAGRVSTPGIVNTLVRGSEQEKQALPHELLEVGVPMMAGGLAESAPAAAASTPNATAAVRPAAPFSSPRPVPRSGPVRSFPGKGAAAAESEGGAAGVTGVAGDLMDVFVPKTKTRLGGAGRLIKKAQKMLGKTEPAPVPEVDPDALPHASAGKGTSGVPISEWGKPIPPRVPVARSEPAWKKLQKGEGEGEATAEAKPGSEAKPEYKGNPARKDFRPNVRRGLSKAQKKVARKAKESDEKPDTAPISVSTSKLRKRP